MRRWEAATRGLLVSQRGRWRELSWWGRVVGQGRGDAQLLALRCCGFCWAGLSARAGWELGHGAGLRRERWKEELGWFGF